VRWFDLGPFLHQLSWEDATWKPYEEILHVYPNFDLEDKACFEEGRDVMEHTDPTNRRRQWN